MIYFYVLSLCHYVMLFIVVKYRQMSVKGFMCTIYTTLLDCSYFASTNQGILLYNYNFLGTCIFPTDWFIYQRMASRRPQKITIFVRFNSNKNIPVNIDPQWRVSRLKQEIAANQGVDPAELRIIFAGRELKNDLQLKVHRTVNSSSSCKIYHTHVLHCHKGIQCNPDITILDITISPI